MRSRLAAREKLDNLIFVVNCNLQRLDGPVRGNKRIIDELEGVFRGANWNVIQGDLGQRLGPVVRARPYRLATCAAWKSASMATTRLTRPRMGAYLRQHFFGKYPELLELVKDDDRRATGTAASGGGMTRRRSITPTSRRWDHKGGPTVILAKTVKGLWLGSAQARNATHSEKKLTDDGAVGICEAV